MLLVLVERVEGDLGERSPSGRRVPRPAGRASRMSPGEPTSSIMAARSAIWRRTSSAAFLTAIPDT